MFTSNIHTITHFGIQSRKGCFPYPDRLNELILMGIQNETPTVTITCISSYHREIQRVDLKEYIVERINLLDEDMGDTERFYHLIGKQNDQWVKIVPDVEYPEFTVEYFGLEPIQYIIRYFRIEAAMAVTKDGVIVIYSDHTSEILFTVSEILKIGKMECRYRKMNVRYIPFDIKFYYSPIDKNIVTFLQNDILTDNEKNNHLFIYNSNGEKVYLHRIRIFESFSPEKQKKLLFEKINPELIAKSHDPYRYFDWCLDEQDKFRISNKFVV